MVSLLPIVLVIFFAAIVVAAMLIGPHFVAPRRDTPVKSMPYESGMDPVGDARHRFDVRFYLVAIVFLLFDVELLFLYPWAVAAWNDAGLQSPEVLHDGTVSPLLIFAELLVFMGLLGVAYVYAWRRGVFRWK